MRRRKNKRLKTLPRELKPNTVHIFTDGSCYPNPGGPGGWAAIMLFNGMRKEIFGGQRGTTNNEMELTAILRGLQALRSRKYPVVIYSDSRYCIDAVTVWHIGWRKRGWLTADGNPVKNLGLIQQIIDLSGGVIFQWVKGHIGIAENERADFLAGEGRRLHGK